MPGTREEREQRGKVLLTLEVTPQEREALKRYARSQTRSMAQQVRYWIQSAAVKGPAA